MSDYKTTRDAARTITTRYEKMLRSLSEDYQDEMVVVSLMNHYQLCSVPNTHEDGIEIDLDDTILVAIERVLEYYMPPSHFKDWKLALKDKENSSGR